jgi:hypothetical protein
MPDKVLMEFDDRGSFRLVVNGEHSEWSIYEHPCIFKGYIGMTQYYDDKEQIYVIGSNVTPVEVVPVCRECSKPSGWNGESYGPEVCEHLRKQYDMIPIREK